MHNGYDTKNERIIRRLPLLTGPEFLACPVYDVNPDYIPRTTMKSILSCNSYYTNTNYKLKQTVKTSVFFSLTVFGLAKHPPFSIVLYG